MDGETDRLIFLGDVAHPGGVSCPEPPACFEGATTIANLEGTLVTGMAEKLLPYGKVFNDISILPYLKALNVGLVSLANNHVFDLTASTGTALKALEAEGIAACGAGDDSQRAAQPAVLHREGREYVFLAFGWAPIGCVPARDRSAGVNPLTGRNVLESVLAVRRQHPDAKLVILMHWDYELERYPQPAHRQLAFAAVDQGADAVIGHHSHCVQGIEWRGRAPIVYGLGNWWFPQGKFMDGKLRFPKEVKRQLAFEWRADAGDGVCHWFEYEIAGHTVSHVETEAAIASARIRELTPYRGMDHRQYRQWFAANRVKRKALPIYDDMNAVFQTKLFDVWVAFRHVLLQAATRTGLLKRS